MADFDTTFLSEITFPSDANVPVSLADAHGFIIVTDDSKDEADHQFFIAYLEILDAMNPDKIHITREWATIIIVDDDGKCSLSSWWVMFEVRTSSDFQIYALAMNFQCTPFLS